MELTFKQRRFYSTCVITPSDRCNPRRHGVLPGRAGEPGSPPQTLLERSGPLVSQDMSSDLMLF